MHKRIPFLGGALIGAIVCVGLVGIGARKGESAGSAGTIYVLDLSASMAYRFGKVSRLRAAQRALVGSLHAQRSDAAIGLISFPGRVRCSTDTLLPVRPIGRVRLSLLNTIYRRIPIAGGTPLAGALQRAGRMAYQRLGRTRIVVLTDGTETCGGNPIAVVRRWRSLAPRIEFHVIGMSMEGIAAQQMKVLTLAGGGRFRSANSVGQLRLALRAYARGSTPEVAGCKAAMIGDFRDNADGTAIDLRSGLTWQRCEAGRGFRDCGCRNRARLLGWRAAVGYCKALRLAGRRWRLPGIDEARSLHHPGRSGIDLEGLPATAPFVIWTRRALIRSRGAEAHAFHVRGNYSFLTPIAKRYAARCVAVP